MESFAKWLNTEGKSPSSFGLLKVQVVVTSLWQSKHLKHTSTHNKKGSSPDRTIIYKMWNGYAAKSKEEEGPHNAVRVLIIADNLSNLATGALFCFRCAASKSSLSSFSFSSDEDLLCLQSSSVCLQYKYTNTDTMPAKGCQTSPCNCEAYHQRTFFLWILSTFFDHFVSLNTVIT